MWTVPSLADQMPLMLFDLNRVEGREFFKLFGAL